VQAFLRVFFRASTHIFKLIRVILSLKIHILPNDVSHFQTFLPNFLQFRPKMTPYVLKISTLRPFYWENLKLRMAFSTEKFDMIRVSQYLINGLKGGCKGHKYSKNLKKPLSASTGMTSETLIYHNACTLK